MNNALTLAAVIVGSMLYTSAEAMDKCKVATCEEAFQNCTAHRTRAQISPSVLTCEASAAKCRSTGIWSGKYSRGPCKMP